MARNPSYDEIRGRKIPVLSEFSVNQPSELTETHLGQIESRLTDYFRSDRGTTTFFHKLGPLLAAAGSSFASGRAVHLDLSPWPTVLPWSKLDPGVRLTLLEEGVLDLVEILKRTRIKRLFINGACTYLDLRRGFGTVCRRRGLVLGEIEEVAIRLSEPIFEGTMTLADADGDREIAFCFWNPFIYAGHHDSTADLEAALRARFDSQAD